MHINLWSHTLCNPYCSDLTFVCNLTLFSNLKYFYTVSVCRLKSVKTFFLLCLTFWSSVYTNPPSSLIIIMIITIPSCPMLTTWGSHWEVRLMCGHVNIIWEHSMSLKYLVTWPWSLMMNRLLSTRPSSVQDPACFLPCSVEGTRKDLNQRYVISICYVYCYINGYAHFCFSHMGIVDQLI